jgi:hypothetical protein
LDREGKFFFGGRQEERKTDMRFLGRRARSLIASLTDFLPLP